MSFWNKQSVIYNDNNEFTEIQKNIILPDTPYPLPNHYEWNFQLSNEEIYLFLKEHYNDNNFSLLYSLEFINWYRKDIIVSVKTNNQIVGFIIGTIQPIIIKNNKKKCVFINFLCTHKQIRKKRLSTILIKEITRQISKLNIFIAMYCSQSKLHLPITQSNYYHYFVNVPKIIQNHFYDIPEQFNKTKIPIKTLSKYYHINTIEHNMIPFTEEHIPDVLSLFTNYFEKFTIHIDFEQYDITTLFYQENIIYSYISTDKTEFISFYLIPIQTKNEILYNIYTLYLISNDYQTLFQKLYTIVKELQFDMISIYNNMDNQQIINHYNFETGQTFYQYIYNFKYKQINSNENAVSFY